jgi:hypothetical protein
MQDSFCFTSGQRKTLFWKKKADDSASLAVGKKGMKGFLFQNPKANFIMSLTTLLKDGRHM